MLSYILNNADPWPNSTAFLHLLSIRGSCFKRDMNFNSTRSTFPKSLEHVYSNNSGGVSGLWRTLVSGNEFPGSPTMTYSWPPVLQNNNYVNKEDLVAGLGAVEALMMGRICELSCIYVLLTIWRYFWWNMLFDVILYDSAPTNIEKC